MSTSNPEQVRVIAIPVKNLSRCKRRLSPALSPVERGALTLAMLEDVLDATLDLTGWQTWVVSSDEAVLEIAAGRGARAIPEERPTLLAAVRQVESEAIEGGATALAVLHADLPLLTRDALASALRTLGPVVIAPGKGEGTNLLLRRPPRVIPASFGKESLSRHRVAAANRELPAAVVDRGELRFDIDYPDDVLDFLQMARDGRTRETCLELGLPSRLLAGA